MPEVSIKVHPVYAVVGHDRFLRGEALDSILHELAPHVDATGPTSLDGKSASLTDVLDEVRTPSLLGGRRVVIVDNADEFITEHRESLEKNCADPALGGCLILLCDSMPKNTKLRKIIAAAGEVVECEPPKTWAIPGWMVRRAKDAYAKKLNQDAAQMLKEHVGDSLGAIDAELAKLASYVGDRTEITLQDIEAATGENRQEKVFGVMDAITSGDAAAGLRLWEQVLSTDRAAPEKAIGGLAWSARRLLEARREWEHGAELGGLARRLFADPQTLQRRLEQNSVAELLDMQRELLAADLESKTGLTTPEVAVERFIVRHSTRSAATRRMAG